jgi:2,3-dihydroxybenzoate decarboxylase
MMEMSMDHIMFSVDYPFVAHKPAMDWLETLQLSKTDMRKLLSGNARRVLNL